MNNKQTISRKLTGIVKSAKMQKTLVVLVANVKIHPKYHKRYTVSKSYKVHDEQGKYREGDAVSFVACRPMSKEKRWRVIY